MDATGVMDLHVRLPLGLKEPLREFARQDRRTIKGAVEMLIIEELRKRGVEVDDNA